MKANFLLLFTLFSLIACKQEQKNEGNSSWQVISQNLKFLETTDQIELQSGKFSYKIPKKALPFKKIIVLNASLIGYLSTLNAEDFLIGVSSPEYIYSEKIHALIKSGKIQNVGNEQKYDVEKIIALQPDLVITNYISSFENIYNTLKSNGVQVIFLDEFTEQNPLEKSAYLKVFGKFLEMEKQAEKLYSEIENNYVTTQKLVVIEQSQPIVISNNMYGNIWYMPGGKTAVAQFINDAGGNYILKDNNESKAVNMNFEEVFALSQNAQIWVNAGNQHSKKELLATNPNYSRMNVFQKGKIYGVNGRQRNKSNDYFESGVVRADWVLKDYVKIFYPQLLPKHDLIYMQEIQ